MSAEARRNGWRGFESIGERVERGQFGNPPKTGGWMYYCDGMPSYAGCGESLIITRRLARVGVKKSGWLVCYGMEPKPEFGGKAEFADPSHWEEDRDVVLTFCPSCRVVVEGKS